MVSKEARDASILGGFFRASFSNREVDEGARGRAHRGPVKTSGTLETRKPRETVLSSMSARENIPFRALTQREDDSYAETVSGIRRSDDDDDNNDNDHDHDQGSPSS